MTLLQLAEPLFQYICRLNRIGRRGSATKSGADTAFISLGRDGAAAAPKGATIEYTVARDHIVSLIENIMSKGATDPRLSQQTRKIELPLIFFVDSMISESKVPFASQWNQNRIAYDRQELAGDEKFFDLLDETMKDPSEDASERLAVFYTGIGLGFTGIYLKQQEFLRKTLFSIAPRIRHLIENDQTAKLCPATYEALDTRNLIQPPGSRLLIVGMVFACFTLAVMISYVVMYRAASRNLNSSMEEVLKQDLSSDSPTK